MILGGHLPVLQVVVPLIAAPVCLLVHAPRAAWAVATVVSWVTLLIAVVLAIGVLDTGVVSYALGGWAAPWGIEYRVDALNALVLVIVAGVSSLTLIFARGSVEREVRAERIYLLYTAWMLCLTGLLGITVTGDAFNVFVFLEIASLSSYLLVSLGPRRRALLAAFRYLVLGTVGATFFLIGIGLLYSMTGTLNMADLAVRLPAVADTRTVHAALAFVVVGMGLKAALFPLHWWLPDAYSEAPSAVSAFFAGTATKVAVYVLVRFLFTVFGSDVSFASEPLGQALVPFALTGILVASAVAVFQDDAKRLFAWSSVAQVGYMLLGVGLASLAGLSAGIVHLFNHALIKVALFLALGNVAYRTGSVAITSMTGLGRRMPWTMAAFVIAGASLVGVPLTAGFVTKWMLLGAALEQGLWFVAVLVIAASLMAAVYVWRVLEAAYFREPEPGTIQAKAREVPWVMLAPLWILALANVYFGIDTSFSLGMAQRAAAGLLGVSP